jgi:glycosyltransferase involved in cell wall biosynthesis
VREGELGLTPARLRGIQESKGELLVFVDDDNVLDETYLANARTIAATYPFIGAFNGSLTGEFEEPPPRWAARHIGKIGIGEIDRDYWSNCTSDSLAVPCGAGLCVRRVVAEDYAGKVSVNPLRRALGRTGSGMASGEDVDLAFCAIDLGMGTGRFRALTLTHLIPKNRLTLDYIARLDAGNAASSLILKSFREKADPSEVPLWREMLQLALAIARVPWRERRIPIAKRKALREARTVIESQRSRCAPA